MIRRILAAILCAALIALGGCSQRGEDASSAPLVDYPATALDITVDTCPQAVVSLIPEVTDIIVALSSDAQLVAISDNCNDTRGLTRVGTAFSPDTAAIKELNADLVFTSQVTPDKDIEVLKNAGINVATVEAVARYTDLPAVYSQVATLMSGNITGMRNAANTIGNIDEKIKKFSNLSDFKTTAVIYAAEGVAVTNDCVQADLAGFAGASIVSDASSAEVIVCPQNIFETVSEQYADKQVVVFDVNMLDARGTGMLDAIEQLQLALKAECE